MDASFDLVADFGELVLEFCLGLGACSTADALALGVEAEADRAYPALVDLVPGPTRVLCTLGYLCGV
jgi:hypothetical protein